jgi:hypothetical protein
MFRRLGFVTNGGLIGMVLTLLIVSGVVLARGNELFSPGALNDQTGAALGGHVSHADIGGECSLCHTAPWEKATMADRCVKCHADIALQLQDAATLHGVLFKNNTGLKCRTCHPEHRGPNSPVTALEGINFPHEVFGFSLMAHKNSLLNNQVGCMDCHQSGFKNFDPNKCTSCHEKKDVQFMQTHFLSFGADCLACHDGLETYGKKFSHDDYPFKLTGKHILALCTQCHQDARSITDLRTTPQVCNACHQKDDPHAGRFGLNCETCHTPDGWKPAKFDHNLANFKLEGKHADVPCEKCHLDGKYQGTPMDCFSCHKEVDAHQGRFGTGCGNCHSVNGWKPATFDHALAAFKLTGKHIGVPCESCHVNNVFKGTPMDCYSCHSKNDQHNGRFGTNCAACHSTSGWLPATFDHALSGFPLTGAHSGLQCTRCHANNNFQGISSQCVNCHAEPAFHAGSFGTDCAACHSTVDWNASYTGSHPAININHEGASCRDCHTVNLSTATCTKCHDSNNPGDGGD